MWYAALCRIMPRITYIKPKDEMIMYCDKPIIILPEKISVLRDVKNQSIYTDFEQYSIYYKNIIYLIRYWFWIYFVIGCEKITERQHKINSIKSVWLKTIDYIK